MFTRMAPVFAVMPDDMTFPPETTEEMVRLAEIAGALWPLSHKMGLAAVGLFALGYWVHAHALATTGHRIVALTAALIASLAFGLFAAALVIDGFMVPAAAADFTSGQVTLAEVQAVHDRALAFFTPGVFAMFIAMGVLSSRLLHGFIHSRWLGALGMMLAILGPASWLAGWAGPNWDNLEVGGSLMMLSFLWHLIVGIASLFGRGLRVSERPGR